MHPDDELLWTHKPPVPTRTPRPTEHLWTLRKGGGRVDAELLGQGEWGWEVRLSRDWHFYGSRRFDLRAQAIEHGAVLKADLEAVGWS
jgi:hypothetical protein